MSNEEVAFKEGDGFKEANQNFTISEYLEQERSNEPKGKKWLFLLMIVLIVVWEIIKLPYTIYKAISNGFKRPKQ